MGGWLAGLCGSWRGLAGVWLAGWEGGSPTLQASSALHLHSLHLPYTLHLCANLACALHDIQF